MRTIGSKEAVIRYQCDKCGLAMGADDARRYIVKIEVYAAAGHIDLSKELESGQSSMEQVLEELSQADPDEIEDQTYRLFRFDLCDSCRRKLLAAPLG